MNVVYAYRITFLTDNWSILDINECLTGAHQCDKNAICSNTVGSFMCTCRPGYSGNGIVCSSPARFQTFPQSYEIPSNTKVSLSCAFNNYTSVSFLWIKDNVALNVSKLTAASEKTVRSSGTGIFVGSTKLVQTLSFTVQTADQQGYYWCKVEDSFNRIVESNKSTIKLADVSSTKLSLRVNQQFSSLLLDRSSAYYRTFEKNVTNGVKNALSKKGIIDQSLIVLQNIRKGSVLVDALVYYANVDAPKRTNLCQKAVTLLPADLSSSGFVVTTVTATSYDCCFAEFTGDAAIKGVLNWPETVYGLTANVTCPYNSSSSSGNVATRSCKGFGFDQPPKWQVPNNDKCPYKTKTTQALFDLSQAVVNTTTVVETAEKLENLTKDPDLLTNNLDIKFAVDTVENVANVQERLVETIESVINVTNNLMDALQDIITDAQIKHNSSEKLLAACQKLVDNIPLKNATTTFTTVKKNIALGIRLVDAGSAEGISIEGMPSSQSNYNNIVLRNAPSASVSTSAVANIFLPVTLLQKTSAQNISRITAFLYENSKLFVASFNQSTTRVIDSKVLSASIKGVELRNLNEDEELRGFFQPVNQTISGTPDCVYWNFTRSEWASDGCRYVGDTNGFRTCRCNHLTNFAVLMNIGGGKITEDEKLAINIITYIGCGVSLLALTLTLLTYLIFRKALLKTSPSRIHMCLCISLVGSLVSLLIGMNSSNKTQCQASSVLIHYFVLSSFMWMAAEAYNLYLHFITVFNAHRRFLLRKLMLVAWGIPLVIVAVTGGVTKLDCYTARNGSELICMIKGIPFYVAYLAPILLIVIGNFVIMCLSFKKIFVKSSVQKHNQLNAGRRLRIVAACTILMGTTWVLGVFAIGELTFTFQLLFTIFNSLQGTFIFIFYCLLSKDARNEWKRVLGCATQLPGTSTGRVSTGSQYKRNYRVREKDAHSSNDDNPSKGTHFTNLSENSHGLVIQNIVGESRINDTIAAQKKGDNLEEATSSTASGRKVLCTKNFLVESSDEEDPFMLYHVALEMAIPGKESEVNMQKVVPEENDAVFENEIKSKESSPSAAEDKEIGTDVVDHGVMARGIYKMQVKEGDNDDDDEEEKDEKDEKWENAQKGDDLYKSDVLQDDQQDIDTDDNVFMEDDFEKGQNKAVEDYTKNDAYKEADINKSSDSELILEAEGVRVLAEEDVIEEQMLDSPEAQLGVAKAMVFRGSWSFKTD